MNRNVFFNLFQFIVYGNFIESRHYKSIIKQLTTGLVDNTKPIPSGNWDSLGPGKR